MSRVSFHRTKPELRFISKEGPRWSIAIASPFCSNGVSVEVYSCISCCVDECSLVQEEEEIVEGETVQEEGAFDINRIEVNLVSYYFYLI